MDHPELKSRLLNEFLERKSALSLSSDQKNAVFGALFNKCSMILGKPGVGKSFVVKNVMIPFWEEWGILYQVMAPTGIAALNIGSNACTVDKFIWCRTVNSAKIDYIVIDETSMMSSGKLDNLIRRQLSKLKKTHVVFLGDFQQLPPPDQNSTFAFEHDYFRNVQFYQLTTIFRQSNPDFIRVLDDVGKGKLTPLVEAFIRDRSEAYDLLSTLQKESMFRLYYSNKNVDRFNALSLAKLKGTAVTYYQYVNGKSRLDAPSAEPNMPDNYRQLDGFQIALGQCNLGDIELKVGCRIIVTRNISKTIVNGTRGIVLGLGEKRISIKTESDEEDTIDYVEHTLEFDLFDTNKHKHVTHRARVCGLPVKPGYASTIHKAQGLTLNSAIINLNIWTPTHGLMYVALSRVRRFTDVYIDGFNRNAVYCHPHVLDFINRPRHLNVSPRCATCHSLFMLSNPPTPDCPNCIRKEIIRKQATERKTSLDNISFPLEHTQKLIKSRIYVKKIRRGHYNIQFDETSYSNISKTKCRQAIKTACRSMTNNKGARLDQVCKWFWSHSFLD